MARKFKRKPGLFFCYLPFCGKISKNQIIEDDRCIPYLNKHFIEIFETPVEKEISLEEEALLHLADILPEEEMKEINLDSFENLNINAAPIPEDLVNSVTEPGLEVKKPGRKKKIVVE